MNGLNRKEISHHNTALYLYCYAQGGLPFLRFMSVNEYPTIAKLSTKGYSPDEVATALCGIALGRDMTEISINYGLLVTPDRVAAATTAIHACLGNQ